MTDKQIVQFILHRARKNGMPAHLTNPRLIIYKPNSNYYLAVAFESNTIMYVRFTRNNSRGMFKINVQHPDFDRWKQSIGNDYCIDYDLDKLPTCIKHHVSYAIIEALKMPRMGFDLFSIDAPDIKLIDQNETYEEASIETDLLDFDFDLPCETNLL